MSRVLVEFNTDSAAFDDNLASEIARILRELADKVEDGHFVPALIRDINGNSIGFFNFEAD